MQVLDSSKTKKGVASLYVVIFVTILFGVIALSFIRIILSENTQSSNDDLSQSALDSALVGVEDAKRAVNQYYQCVNASGDSATCGSLFGGNCDDFRLKTYLYGDTYPGEVLVQESTSNNADQAYTCVILANRVPDYRSTLTSDTRTRVIPLGIGSTSLSEVKSVTFRWYSEINGTDFRLNSDGKLGAINNATTPPTLTLSLLKTGPNIDINSFNNSTSTNYSTMVLLPSSDNSAVNTITQAQINEAGNSDIANTPFLIKCEHNEFACEVELSGLDFEAGGNAMLVVSMPYGDTITDFALTLQKNDGTVIEFENVQISVDSTGRANQLVRRIETRLDPADIFFPYPQYEVELSGDDDNSLRKNFWITQNCWTENGPCDNNGQL